MLKAVVAAVAGLSLFGSIAQAFVCQATGQKYSYRVSADQVKMVNGDIKELVNPWIHVSNLDANQPFFTNSLTLAQLTPYTKYGALRSSAKLSVTIGAGNVIKVWHEEFGHENGANSYDCLFE